MIEKNKHKSNGSYHKRHDQFKTKIYFFKRWGWGWRFEVRRGNVNARAFHAASTISLDCWPDSTSLSIFFLIIASLSHNITHWIHLCFSLLLHSYVQTMNSLWCHLKKLNNQGNYKQNEMAKKKLKKKEIPINMIEKWLTSFK